jgi:hypothetical protein
MRAAEVGRRAARRQWYSLRRQVLRLSRLAARNGLRLLWGQPWRGAPLAVHGYLVSAEKNQIVGEGDISWADTLRADCRMRQWLSAR